MNIVWDGKSGLGGVAMACQKVAAGGVIGSGQIADPVLADGFGWGERGGDEGRRG